MRVRSMNMNDAHLYCTAEQFADEFRAVNDMYLKYFRSSDSTATRCASARMIRPGSDRSSSMNRVVAPDRDMVRNVLIESGINYIEVPNEAAFYGPKIDVQVWSAIGREFTIATNQVDFAVPKRFGRPIATGTTPTRPLLCIHRAPLGTHERFIGFLIEHYAGNFPLWLAPNKCGS